MNEISNAFVTQKFNGPLGELTAYVDKETGDLCFLAKDIACSLKYVRSNGKVMASDMLRFLDEDEKGTLFVRTPGGTQEVSTVSESGLYHAIFKSKKKEANEFRKWVTSVVLPSIRKNGGYILGQENLSVEDQAELVDEVKRLRDMVQNKQRRIDDLVVERDIARNDARFSEDEAHYWQEQYERSCWN